MNLLMSLQEYLQSPLFEVPSKPLIYSPQRSCGFSLQGEQMVESLIKVSPNFAYLFDQVFEKEAQRSFATGSFEKQKQIFLEQKAPVSLDLVLDQKPTKKYFETNRSFDRLVPLQYHRTSAPRLSAKGSTFHGMKKVLLVDILKEISKTQSSFIYVDLDMGAAHTRIARYLLANDKSQLDASLKDPEFWQTQIQDAKPCFQKRGLSLENSLIKKILKVGIYTSLNGGNPLSNERLLANLSTNAESYLKENNLVSISDITESSIFKASSEALSKFKLLEEVKEINTTCTGSLKTSDFEKEQAYTYTVDKEDPYYVDSPHKGISRVLQGFEIVLLTVLVKDVIELGAIPISLDHDGILVMMPVSVFRKFNENSFELSQFISEKGAFKAWSTYLLREPIPIEPKRLIWSGKLEEF